MTDARTSEARISLSPDPAVWLTGPHGPASPEAWTGAALKALVSDFGVAPASPEERYLREVLEAFVDADLGEFRFLRMRAVGDPPVAARLDVALRSAGDPDPLTVFEEDVAWYDHAPSVVTVDEPGGLRRATRLYVEDGVRVAVRHHRFDAENRADIVVSSIGHDLRTTALVLDHLAALCLAVRLEDERS